MKPPMHTVGSIIVTELTVLSRHYGRDFIPFPFMHTSSTEMSPEQAAAHAKAVLQRFDNGDLRAVRDWARTYVRADIRVEGHVQFIPADRPNVRVVAHRLDEKGYFARQTAGDIIEICSMSPYDLGPAVAEAMNPITPGTRAAITIPAYENRAPRRVDATQVSVRASREDDGVLNVARTDVTALGTVQSHWRPTRRWGVDRGKPAAVWVRLRQDGDYLYDADLTLARPMSSVQLARRIDRLIADDITVLRQFRRDG